ncbi:MAG: metallophosphoesterase, partial [Coprobacter sp.]|nr:metallophosphoesterase [Coprobacter sp.]
NHDYGDYVQWDSPLQKVQNLSALKQAQSAAGWTMLDNASVFLHRAGDSIALIGVENWGEPPFPQYGDLKTAYGRRTDDCFKILMTHNPVHWDREVLPETDIDLSLSGHTHAMQMKIRLGRWQASPSSWRYPRWSGLYREGDRYLYVNEGIGCVFYPMRIGARPEITLLTLKRETARK